MNILIIHEIDWIKKVIFEPHHLAELFSLKGHTVIVIDCPQPDMKNLSEGFQTTTLQKYHRIYEDASIMMVRPPSLRMKGLNRFTYFIIFEKILRKIIVDNKIDIILLYGIATNGIQTLKIAKEMKIPVIFRALDVAHGLVRIPILRQLVKKYEKRIMSNVELVLTTTPKLARYAIEMGAKQETTEYFPYGINAQHFKPMIKDLKLAQKIGISEKDSVIVFVGTIYDFAGLEGIISKFKILKQKMPNIKFLIVGGGPYYNKIRSLIQENRFESDILLTGFKPQNEIPKYISLADICINPFVINYVTDSIVPAKIFEYMACQKPVISTPLKGTVELLPNENFGIVYATSDIFVEKLIELLSDKEKLVDLGKKGYAYVKRNYDWDSLSNKLIQKFENLILHHRPDL